MVFLFYEGSTAQVRGKGFGMARPPVLPFSFLRATIYHVGTQIIRDDIC
jgi:hypothetical protein